MRKAFLSLLPVVVLLAGCGEEQASAPTTPVAIPTAPIATPTPDAPTKNPPTRVARGKGFDFYVLSLSWSPSYCEAEGGDANRQQCDSGRPYAFVVHGLWPQFEKGYPADCPTRESDVAREIVSDMLPLMPSTGLIRHQWRKHGSCAGLSQEDYFDVVRAARARVTVPQEYARLRDHRTVTPGEVETAFIKANPGLDANEVAVSCDRRYLREVRVCMTTSLEFRACPEVDRRSCRLGKAVMPPVRGG